MPVCECDGLAGSLEGYRDPVGRETEPDMGEHVRVFRTDFGDLFEDGDIIVVAVSGDAFPGLPVLPVVASDCGDGDAFRQGSDRADDVEEAASDDSGLFAPVEFGQPGLRWVEPAATFDEVAHAGEDDLTDLTTGLEATDPVLDEGRDAGDLFELGTSSTSVPVADLPVGEQDD